MAYSPWGHKESDTTEQLSMHAHTDINKSFLLIFLKMKFFLGGGKTIKSTTVFV